MVDAAFFACCRLVIYGFCVLLSIALSSMGVCLWILDNENSWYLKVFIALNVASVIITAVMCVSAVVQRRENKPLNLKDVSIFDIVLHICTFALHLGMVALLAEHRMTVTCGKRQQGEDTDIVFPNGYCKLHDGSFGLVWVNYAGFMSGLALCFVAADDVRKYARLLWCMLFNLPIDKDETLPAPSLPEHTTPRRAEHNHWHVNYNETISLLPRGVQRLANPPPPPRRASWFNFRTRSAPCPPPETELLPLSPSAYNRGQVPIVVQLPTPRRGIVDRDAHSGPAGPSFEKRPTVNLGLPELPPLAQDIVAYRNNAARRLNDMASRDTSTTFTNFPTRLTRTTVPPSRLGQRAPRRPADSRQAKVNSRNMV